MKNDRFVLAIVLAVIVFILVAIAVTFIEPAESANNNTTPTSFPQLLPTAMPGTLSPDNLTQVVDDCISGPRTDNITWSGSVQDSFGKPYGGLNVTLHLMTPAGEAFNVTGRSAVDLPYPGAYEFTRIPVTSDITHAYAEAVAEDLGDGIQYHGRSDNYTLNSERMSSGYIVLHVPMPDMLNVTAENSTLLPKNVAFVNNVNASAPNTTLITARLFLNGKPYNRSGLTITFLSDAEAVATLPGIRAGPTDESGRTSIVIASNGTGTANITGYTKIGISKNLTGTCTVQVAG